MITSHNTKSEIVSSDEQLSLRPLSGALDQDLNPVEHGFKSAAPAVTATPVSVGDVAIRPRAFAIEVGESQANEVRSRLGDDALGVQAPSDETAFVFSGGPYAVARPQAGSVGSALIPSQRRADGTHWEAGEAYWLVRFGEPHGTALPSPPKWLLLWLVGTGMEHFAVPTSVMGHAGGMAAGWSEVTSDGWHRHHAPRAGPPHRCGCCRCDLGAPAGLEAWHDELPGAPVDKLDRAVGRAAPWPSTKAQSRCGQHEPAGSVGRA